MNPNPQFEMHAVERAQLIALGVLNGSYDLLLACRDIAAIRDLLPFVGDEIMDTFVGVASETDDLPIGSERENWSRTALVRKDFEAAEYRGRIRAVVEGNFRGLLRLLAQGRGSDDQLVR